MQTAGDADRAPVDQRPTDPQPLLRPCRLPRGSRAGAGAGSERGAYGQLVRVRQVDGNPASLPDQARQAGRQLPRPEDRGHTGYRRHSDAAGLSGLSAERRAVSVGCDLRVRNTTTLRGHIHKQGEVERNHGFRPEVLSNDTRVFEFLGYGQIDLWPDLVTLYADEEFTGGANSREAFALLKAFLPWDSYIKVGRMFPTFGLRVQDDQAYVRARSGYTFQNPDTGAEFGTQPGPFYLGTTITNGTSGDKDVSATVNGYGVFEDVPVVRNVLAGASFARQTDKRDVASFYLGSNLGALTYLAEFDPIWDRTVASVGKRDQYAAYSELDYLLFDWLN